MRRERYHWITFQEQISWQSYSDVLCVCEEIFLIVSFHLLLQLHQQQCPFASVKCQYCELELVRDQVSLLRVCHEEEASGEWRVRKWWSKQELLSCLSNGEPFQTRSHHMLQCRRTVTISAVESGTTSVLIVVCYSCSLVPFAYCWKWQTISLKCLKKPNLNMTEANLLMNFFFFFFFPPQMESHCDTDCPKAPIACNFSIFGCKERVGDQFLDFHSFSSHTAHS